jgi:hypothetical protein
MEQVLSRGSASYLLYAAFLLDLFFNHEDGGDMFFRNVGWHSADYAALYPGRQNLPNHSSCLLTYFCECVICYAPISTMLWWERQQNLAGLLGFLDFSIVRYSRDCSKKNSNPVCYTPSSEPSRINKILHHRITSNVFKAVNMFWRSPLTLS